MKSQKFSLSGVLTKNYGAYSLKSTCQLFSRIHFARGSILKNSPQISVIIPVYNDSKNIAICLEALAFQDLSVNDFEILIIDNGSNPPVEILSLPANAKIIVELKPGSYAARNTGVVNASAKILAFTDADCIPRVNWLSQSLRELKVCGRNAIIGGAINITPAKKGKPNFVEAYDMSLGLRQDRYVSMGNFAATANMITWKELFLTVGFFNYELKSGGDYEWGNRAVEQNKKLYYCPEVVVSHPARKTLKSIVTKVRRVSGGIIDVDKKAQSVPGGLDGIKGTPLASIRSILINKKLPRLSQKIGVLLVSVVVLGVTVFEKFRLSFGFDSERR